LAGIAGKRVGGLRALLLLLRHCVGHGDVEDSMIEEMEE